MAELFKSSRTNILEHIQKIYEDNELNEMSTCRKFRQVRQEGKRMVNREITIYNLDMKCLKFENSYYSLDYYYPLFFQFDYHKYFLPNYRHQY